MNQIFSWFHTPYSEFRDINGYQNPENTANCPSLYHGIRYVSNIVISSGFRSKIRQLRLFESDRNQLQILHIVLLNLLTRAFVVHREFSDSHHIRVLGILVPPGG